MNNSHWELQLVVICSVLGIEQFFFYREKKALTLGPCLVMSSRWPQDKQISIDEIWSTLQFISPWDIRRCHICLPLLGFLAICVINIIKYGVDILMSKWDSTRRDLSWRAIRGLSSECTLNYDIGIVVLFLTFLKTSINSN